ncbi:unnamed protein product, partial [Meganyctiphanes norvegica]
MNLWHRQSEQRVDASVRCSAVHQSHICKVIQLNRWFYKEHLPSSCEPLLAVLQHLNSLDMNSKPLLLSCKNGYAGCGVALALHMILTRMNELQEVDVYRAVHCIRHSNPHFISTLDEYEFLYKSIASQLLGHSIYGNIFS